MPGCQSIRPQMDGKDIIATPGLSNQRVGKSCQTSHAILTSGRSERFFFLTFFSFQQRTASECTSEELSGTRKLQAVCSPKICKRGQVGQKSAMWLMRLLRSWWERICKSNNFLSSSQSFFTDYDAGSISNLNECLIILHETCVFT